jgi:hypothetical protein
MTFSPPPQHFYAPLRRSASEPKPILSSDQFDVIFGNFEPVYESVFLL